MTDQRARIKAAIDSKIANYSVEFRACLVDAVCVALQEPEVAELDKEQRAELCRCGHSRGNHRWYAVGGKRPCYDFSDELRCGCAAFTAPQDVSGATE